MTLLDGRVIDNPRVVLEQLARDSGAESFFPRSDIALTKAVEKIADDLRRQYTVASTSDAREQLLGTAPLLCGLNLLDLDVQSGLNLLGVFQ